MLCTLLNEVGHAAVFAAVFFHIELVLSALYFRKRK